MWLGTTIACTECHNHKFDPFTQKEYYQLLAFFNGIPENGLDGTKVNPVPSLRVPTPEETAAAETSRTNGRRWRNASRAKRQKSIWTTPPGRRWSSRIFEPRGDRPVGRRAAAQRMVLQGNEGTASWRFVTKPAARFSAARSRMREPRTGLSQHFFTGATPPLHISAGDKLFTYVWLGSGRIRPKKSCFNSTTAPGNIERIGAAITSTGATKKSPSRHLIGAAARSRQMGPAGGGRAYCRPGRRLRQCQWHSFHPIRRHGLLGQNGSGNTRSAGDGLYHAVRMGGGEGRQTSQANPRPDRRGASQRTDAQKTGVTCTYYIRCVDAGLRSVFEPLNQEEGKTEKS